MKDLHIDSPSGLLLRSSIHLPAEASPQQWALLMPGWTLSKDMLLLKELTLQLNAIGMGVMRLQVQVPYEDIPSPPTLGALVRALKEAHDFMSARGWNLRLLVGHSIAGLAALHYGDAHHFDGYIATVNAPSSAKFLSDLFGIAPGDMPKEKLLRLGPVRYRLTAEHFREFVDSEADRPLSLTAQRVLITHAEEDATVPVREATRLVQRFSTLPNVLYIPCANHLCNRERSGRQTAKMLASWALSHIQDKTSSTHPAVEVSTATGEDNYSCVVRYPSHVMVVDEPPLFGGKDRGPSPVQLLTAALATCKAITMKMYAHRKGWPIDQIRIRTLLRKEECIDCENPAQRQVQWVLYNTVAVDASLTEEQIHRLLLVGKACTVEKLLRETTTVHTKLDDQAPTRQPAS